MTNTTSNLLLRYLFQSGAVRGNSVRLSEEWQKIVSLHPELPDQAIEIFGQSVAAVLLMASSLKLDGALILQLQGQGPLRMLVVECQSDLTIRATVKWNQDAVTDDLSFNSLIYGDREGLGEARCSVILDPYNRPEGQHPYQGIVSLEGQSMAEALEGYLRQSEQIPSQLFLAANRHHIAGTLLQQMPATAHHAEDPDLWNRLGLLAQTLKKDEQLEESPQTLMHRLFWQEEHTIFDHRYPEVKCRCSRERTLDMLRTLGLTEVESILQEQGQCEVHCDFCNQAYVFDAVDLGALCHELRNNRATFS